MFTTINGNKSTQVAMKEAMRLSTIEQKNTKNKVGKSIKLVGVNIEEY